MSISDRLNNIRQMLPGTPRPIEDERLLQLYWNRAELKKELGRLQDERHNLLEQMKKQEGAMARQRELADELERYLADPDVAIHALVYFQLRGLWRAAATRLARFAEQLQRQQAERERRRHLIQFDQRRRQQLADLDRMLTEMRLGANALETRLKTMERELEARAGFWNYFRRRRLAEEIAGARTEWDRAVTQVTDLSDDRTAIESLQPADFLGISIDGRRIVNTAVIAYAQQLVSLLSKGGLALLAKETTAKRALDVRYGDDSDCTHLMNLLREAFAALEAENEDLGSLKEHTDRLRSNASYHSDADTIPLTDSIGTLPAPVAPVSGLETVNRSGINVLLDDYWELYKALLQ
ncbi:MAG TPA: hypothetical protein VGN07_09115 [Steroidobacteraceae bacterium]|jgi:hypothetical protein